MKYSGVQWIGDIPETWKVTKVKECFYISKEKAHQEKPVVLSLARAGIKVRDISTNEGQLAASYEDYNPVIPGDLLLNPMDLYSGANCNVSEIAGVISSAYINLRKKKELNPKFFDYFFKTQYWTMAMFAHGKGVSFDNRWTMNTEAVLNYYLPYPTLEKQNQIANFLNRKCTEIDSLIQNQEEQIEKLKEYKKLKITEILGINERSGERLKFYLSEQMMYGANESGYSYNDGYVRYIRITDITNDGKLKNSDDNQYLPFDKAEPYLLEEDDILFARSGGTVGKSFIYKITGESAAFAGYLIKAKCNKIKLLPEYLYFFTQSSKYDSWKNMIFIQATIQNIGANKYSNMPIFVPTIEKQQEIINSIVLLNSKIDKLISIKQEKIQKLKDYKKSLIYEYVTGKKEVY